MRHIIITPIALALCACAVVQSNDGDRVVIRNDGKATINSIQEVADESCRAAGKKTAVLLFTQPMNPSVPQAISSDLSTFQCK